MKDHAAVTRGTLVVAWAWFIDLSRRWLVWKDGTMLLMLFRTSRCQESWRVRRISVVRHVVANEKIECGEQRLGSGVASGWAMAGERDRACGRRLRRWSWLCERDGDWLTLAVAAGF